MNKGTTTYEYKIASPFILTHEGGRAFFLRDAAYEGPIHVDFHIASGDYFATLATIMGLLADAMESGNAEARMHSIETLHELHRDLLYAHGAYRIERKADT